MKTALNLLVLVTFGSLLAFADPQPTLPPPAGTPAPPTSPQQPAAREVTINVTDAYIPGGFDRNSDVYVVVNGLFPNSCYKWARADVTNPDTNLHEVRSIASVSQGMCLMVIVPFTKEVRLGKLGSGAHKVRFISGDGTYLEKDITIE